MKVAIIYNRDISNVINKFGIQNKEKYNPKTIGRVEKALVDGGHNVSIIDGDMHVIESIQNFMPKVLEGEKMGMVFNMAYGIQGESRYTHIPSMLEMLGIPYVGSSPTGHALALDKVITKILLQKNNIPTPNFWVFSAPDEDASKVIYPVIVKPKMESVSFGLRVVDNEKDLKDAVAFIIEEFQQQALVEQFISGREFAVGLLGNNPLESFPVLEFDLENNPDAIQSYEDKSQTPRQKICPADLPEDKAEEMIRLSKAAFQALHLKDFARVDFRMDKEGNVYILELNSMASLGATGSYAKAASVAGYDFKMLVNKMLDVAVIRYFTANKYQAEADSYYKKVPMHVRVRGFLRGRQTNLENILKEMININTYVRNVEGVRNLAGLLIKHLSSLGFSYKTYSQVEIGNLLFFTNTNEDEYDILLLANLDNDVKLANHEYYSATEQKIFGTGVWENKGGLGVMLAALQSLKFVRMLRKIKIGILVTTDSTIQGKFAKNIVVQRSSMAKYVIGMHGAFLNGGLVTSRSGAAVYHIHMNLLNNEDASFVSKASAVFLKYISNCAELSNPEEGMIIAPHNFKMQTNITEPYASASVNLSVRFNDTEQMKKIDNDIRNLIPKKFKKIVDIHIDGGIRRPSMVHTEKVDELWIKVKSIAEKLDINLREEHRWSSADICFVGDEKYQIDGMGPIGAKPSNKPEFILKHSLLERAALLASLLTELNGN